MIPLSNILKESESIVIRRVRKKSYPPELNDLDITVAKKTTPEKEIIIKKEKLKDSKNNKTIDIEEEPVVIRKKIKK